MSRYSRLLTVICFLFLLPASLASATPKPFTPENQGLLFTLEGSNTIGARLGPSWVKAWLEAKGAEGVFVEPLPEVNEYRVVGRNGGQSIFVDVHAHGSTTGFQGLKAGTADIAMASRSIKDAEAKALAHLGDLTSFDGEHVVAIDGLAVIVNPANPVKSLTVDQIARIFSGTVRNWKEVGGNDRTINLYARDEKSGTWDTFKSLVLAKQYTLSKTAKRFESNDELSDRVASESAAIGFVGLASVRDSRALAISDDRTTPLKPEVVYVATEDYPLSRRLFMYTPVESSNPWVDEFVAFAHSQSGQNIVETIGFISQNPVMLKVEAPTGPDDYLRLVHNAQRLSVNFRFRPGESDLDNKALQDILRLVGFLNGSGERYHVQLVGFSNSKDTDQRADVLSRLRASAVKIELFRQGVSSQPVMGYGAELLVASDEGSSRLKNDRVEVWLYNNEQAEAMRREASSNRFANGF